jgi:hypothetical protein
VTRGREEKRRVAGAVAAVLLLVLVLAPLRFARAVRRSLRVPEFRGLFVLVVVTLAAGKLFTVFYIFTGIGLIVGFLNAVARTAVEQREEKRGLLDRRTGSPKDE